MKQNQLKKISNNPLTPGLLLISCAVLAMLISNSPVAANYFSIVNSKHTFNLLFIVNDVLMTIFFLDVGLEIKHQIVTGHLSKPKQIFLPAIAAVGGVVLPALIFTACNLGDHLALRGWAVPVATDIAFALGVITLLGKRVPLELKVLLMAIAIIDDLIAIMIIALFYTQDLSLLFLLLTVITVYALYKMNQKKINKITHYLIVGFWLWFCMLNTGVHPTLAGVIVALAMPINSRQIIHKRLNFWVTFVILPIFALTNAGVSLTGLSMEQITQPVPLGIALGLIFGKQLGVFTFAWLSVKLKIAALPKGISWRLLYGMAILCGIGFTMSIFIGNLAYDGVSLQYLTTNKLGVLIGSTVSAVVGYVILRAVPASHRPSPPNL